VRDEGPVEDAHEAIEGEDRAVPLAGGLREDAAQDLCRDNRGISLDLVFDRQRVLAGVRQAAHVCHAIGSSLHLRRNGLCSCDLRVKDAPDDPL